MKLFVAELRLKLQELVVEASSLVESIPLAFAGRERAEMIERAPTAMRPFLFGLKREEEDTSIEQSFVAWLKHSYKRFGALWTETQIEPILAEERKQKLHKVCLFVFRLFLC